MSSGEILILGKMALTFGVLVGFPAWELWQLRRWRRARDERARRDSAAG